MPRLLFLLVAFACLIAQVAAQQVVYEGGLPSYQAGTIRREVDQNGPSWFPVPSASKPDGSLIEIDGDYFNSDVLIVFPKTLLPQIVPRASALARQIGRPQTVIRVTQAQVIGCIDMEFNRYVKFDGNSSTDTVPFGTIVDSVKNWGLPHPTGVVIDKRFSGCQVSLNGKDLSSILLLPTSEIAPWSSVKLAASRHWYGLVTLVATAMLILSSIGGACWVIVMRKKPNPKPSNEAMPTTLPAAQARYDAKRFKPLRIIGGVWPLLLVVTALNRDWVGDAMMWIPPSFNGKEKWLFILFIPMIGTVFLKGFRAKRTAKPADNPLGKMMSIMMVPVFMLMGLVLLIFFAPGAIHLIPRTLFRVVIFGTVGIACSAVFVTMWKSLAKTQPVLGPGDEDYDLAMEMATKAGVKVRKVKVATDQKAVNAYATLWGTVGVTLGFRDKLTFEERRCVIAHEIGHIKGRHVPFLVLSSLVVAGILLEAQAMIRDNGHGALAPLVTLMGSPLLLSVVMSLARTPLQRRTEFAADRFALQTIGDFYAVAHALARLHLLNASPHTLKKVHAALSTHPSLTKRLEHLRQTAIEMGMNIPDDAVAKIIDSVSISEEDSIVADVPESAMAD